MHSNIVPLAVEIPFPNNRNMAFVSASSINQRYMQRGSTRYSIQGYERKKRTIKQPKKKYSRMKIKNEFNEE